VFAAAAAAGSGDVLAYAAFPAMMTRITMPFRSFMLSAVCGLVLFSAACSGDKADPSADTTTNAGSSAAGSGGAGAAGSTETQTRWTPTLGVTWQYQLTDKLDRSVDANVFDIDLYETAEADISALHMQGRKVVCYFDTAYEPDRSDSKRLEPFRGHPVDGWPGQYWLDTREPEVLAVMLGRITLAQEKNCDAVEADDVDARSNDPGFPITAAEQQNFITKLADAAHDNGLAFGLKNDLEEVAALVDHADFAINEQCFEYDECDGLAAFTRAGKPVFNVEYTDGDLATKGAAVCPVAKPLHFASIVKHLELGAERYGCSL
jgi:hypothetical protein